MDWETIRTGVIAAAIVGGGVLLLRAIRTKPDPKRTRQYRRPVAGGGPSMAIFLIILGLVLGLAGACNLVRAIGDANSARQPGSLIVGAAFGVPGVVALIFGINRAGRPKERAGNTLKSRTAGR